ncbi:putative ubiquitin-conjugating enzyme e2 w-like [Moniliophthora roreri]|nr:putative ubiquitin-conjugating enzyme e2 w-like [Moniliophthora roreri]
MHRMYRAHLIERFTHDFYIESPTLKVVRLHDLDTYDHCAEASSLANLLLEMEDITNYEQCPRRDSDGYGQYGGMDAVP